MRSEKISLSKCSFELAIEWCDLIWLPSPKARGEWEFTNHVFGWLCLRSFLPSLFFLLLKSLSTLTQNWRKKSKHILPTGLSSKSSSCFIHLFPLRIEMTEKAGGYARWCLIEVFCVNSHCLAFNGWDEEADFSLESSYTCASNFFLPFQKA